MLLEDGAFQRATNGGTELGQKEHCGSRPKRRKGLLIALPGALSWGFDRCFNTRQDFTTPMLLCRVAGWFGTERRVRRAAVS